MAHLKRKPMAIGAMAAALALTLAACGSSSEGAGTAAGLPSNPADASLAPLLIGYLSSENDPAANYPEGRVAAEAAVQYINTSLGGIDKHPVKLDTCIVQSTPESEQACANQMVADKVVAVLNPYNYSEAVEYPIWQAAGLTSFGGGVTPAGMNAPTNISWTAGSYQLNSAAAYAVVDKLHAKKVAFIYLDAAAMAPVTAGMVAGMAAKGVQLDKVGASATTTDWIPVIQSALDKKPDAIILYAAQAGCIGAMKAYKQLGATTPVVTQTLCTDRSVLDATNNAANGWYVVSFGPWPDNPGENQEIKTFNDALTAYAKGGKINTGGQALMSFSYMMTMYENILKPLGFDGANSKAILDKAKTITSGNAFGSSPLFKCGTYAAIPSACGGAGERLYQLENGKFKAVDGGQFIGTDLAAFGANKPAGA
ncbi:ABC transporter substrate-binding protein [Amycolatopsis sp. K13G38]|uniref:ABC transporter substrate-binding protein n=1 Tax=Amycolatopsis acididurans TaxID=2724524 RepID=A0ABX1JH15_9PSEU|nr:ABC transporter substrate-binding protein [Amycolatopsis acididurans]NKQ58055.1 ABC transporter substrate-binding protein [Amycolatopsis acididurans]